MSAPVSPHRRLATVAPESAHPSTKKRASQITGVPFPTEAEARAGGVPSLDYAGRMPLWVQVVDCAGESSQVPVFWSYLQRKTGLDHFRGFAPRRD